MITRFASIYRFFIAIFPRRSWQAIKRYWAQRLHISREAPQRQPTSRAPHETCSGWRADSPFDDFYHQRFSNCPFSLYNYETCENRQLSRKNNNDENLINILRKAGSCPNSYFKVQMRKVLSSLATFMNGWNLESGELCWKQSEAAGKDGNHSKGKWTTKERERAQGDGWGLPVRYPLDFFPTLGKITRCKNFWEKDFHEKRREEKESRLGVINE